MIDHKAHLQNILKEQSSLSQEISQLNALLANKRELFLKYQGITEYLTANGVKPDKEEATDATEDTEQVQPED